MRDIKFRGKRKDNNQWVTGCLLIEEPPLQCFTSENTEPNKYLIGKSWFADWNMTRPFTAAEVYPESVGQFTGLKENAYEISNGYIYEGDIIEFIDGKIAVVEWNDDTCKFQYSDGSDLNDGELYGTHKMIVGNIYDNPELFK